MSLGIIRDECDAKLAAREVIYKAQTDTTVELPQHGMALHNGPGINPSHPDENQDAGLLLVLADTKKRILTVLDGIGTGKKKSTKAVRLISQIIVDSVCEENDHIDRKPTMSEIYEGAAADLNDQGYDENEGAVAATIESTPQEDGSEKVVMTTVGDSRTYLIDVNTRELLYASPAQDYLREAITAIKLIFKRNMEARLSKQPQGSKPDEATLLKLINESLFYTLYNIGLGRPCYSLPDTDWEADDFINRLAATLPITGRLSINGCIDGRLRPKGVPTVIEARICNPGSKWLGVAVSDGVTKFVDDEEIVETALNALEAGQDPSKAVYDLAIHRQSLLNMGVTVIRKTSYTDKNGDEQELEVPMLPAQSAGDHTTAGHIVIEPTVQS